MKKGVLFTLGLGVGWFLGSNLTIMMLFTNNLLATRSAADAMGNGLVLSFPGIILWSIAMILALKDTTGADF